MPPDVLSRQDPKLLFYIMEQMKGEEYRQIPDSMGIWYGR